MSGPTHLNKSDSAFAKEVADVLENRLEEGALWDDKLKLQKANIEYETRQANLLRRAREFLNDDSK